MAVRMTWAHYRRREIILGRTPVRLSQQQADVAVILVMRAGRYTAADDLIVSVYGDDGGEPDHAMHRLRVLIATMRRKGVPIDKAGADGYRIAP